MRGANSYRPTPFFTSAIAACVATFSFCSADTALAFESEQAGIQFFESKIRPILLEHCYECHSEEGKVKGGLLLDSRDGWLRGGDSGEAIIPGAADESPLIEAIRYTDSDFQMPPKYQLSDAEIDALVKWVNGGAPDPRSKSAPASPERMIDIEQGRTFWAFQAPKKRPLPEVITADWPTVGLDYFLLAGLEAKQLQPAKPASREVLIRRATFDLTGLPPTLNEIDEFLSDPAEDRDAFAKVIDRLIGSERFGERWGRHWLDVVRFGESMGRTRNFPFPYAWRYRNYVIDSLNADIPFDQFLTEQLAGDLIAKDGSPGEKDRLHVATGFLALGSMDLNERNKKKYKMDTVDEQLDVTSRTFMALTTGCARCHDHKFDPIPTADYYAMAGIFASTDSLMGYGNRQGGGNRSSFRPDQYIKLVATSNDSGETELSNEAVKLANAKQRVDDLKRSIRRLQSRKDKQSRQRLRKIQAELNKETKNVRNLEKKSGGKLKLPRNFAMGASEGAQVIDCKVHLRGDVNKLGDKVPRGFLSVISSPFESIPEAQSGRKELANWLTHPDHPLTARVFANRVWHHLFGHGIVRTTDNFGETGTRPSNPALLDHLALRLIEQGWSTKKLIREIMLSSAYRMSSNFSDACFTNDPDNHHFWRMNIRRLEVEAIRDSMLAISGKIDLSRPEGSPLMTVQLAELRNVTQIKNRIGQMNNRSVYLPVVRGHLPEIFEVFDFAEPSQVIGRRDVTTVSPQALYFMNSPKVLDHARMIAERIMRNESFDSEKSLQQLYLRTIGRRATESEIMRGLEFVRESDKPVEGWAGLQQILFASAEFRYLN